ncbi:MAG TPA: serine/threonine protein kinase, partial [Planctomycetaceae bacterium]|nr:serine/threonine protein kinase [Planctomycetaceae bacterium]
LLFVADFSGLLHCVDAKTGKGYWTYDMFAASWASPLIVGDRVYIGDEDGDIAIFEVSKEMNQIGEINMGSAVYTTPIVANDTLFIANRNRLFAIQQGAKSEPAE